MFDYNLRINNVIQALIQPLPRLLPESSSQSVNLCRKERTSSEEAASNSNTSPISQTNPQTNPETNPQIDDRNANEINIVDAIQYNNAVDVESVDGIVDEVAIFSAYCDACDDKPSVRCKVCSCHECGGKNSPEKQIICDECDAIYHIWCLATPLREVPREDEDWYCEVCRNVDKQAIAEREENRLTKRKRSLNRLGNGAWGRGMSCVGRSQISAAAARVGKHHFGPIPGVEVGQTFRFRIQGSLSFATFISVYTRHIYRRRLCTFIIEVYAHLLLKFMHIYCKLQAAFIAVICRD